MPELPEVQTVVNDLQTLTGDTIVDFWSDWKKALKGADSKTIELETFREKIKNKKILSIERFGKSILINLSGNISLLAHLRMTGQLLIKRSKLNSLDKYDKHIHHIFSLKKNGILAFSDIRKFATLKLLTASDVALLKEGAAVDPFADNFSLAVLKKLITNKQNKTLKEFLMDQSAIAGIGNIYASEIPFDAGIDPTRKMNSLTANEQKKLFVSIKKILLKALKLRGTSFSDYRDSAGQKGAFQNMLMVYKKDKQNCKKCGTIITRIVIGQRSTFYCKKCQK